MKLDLGLPSWNVAQIDDITLGQAYTTKVEKLDEAMDPHYRAGMNAAYDGKKASANPHDKFSMEHKLWKQGHKDNYRPAPKDAKTVKEESEIDEQAKWRSNPRAHREVDDDDQYSDDAPIDTRKVAYGDEKSDPLDRRPQNWRSKADLAKRMTKKGKPTASEKGMQKITKDLIQFTHDSGGISGPKGRLPEETEYGIKGTDDVTVKGNTYKYNADKDRHELVKEETESLQEAKPKTIPMGAARHPAAAPGHPNHHQWLAAQPKRPAKAPSVHYGKPIDTSDPKLHKALEDHFGGTFQHFDTDPKHGHTAEGHPVMHARVRHSYTANDFGVPDDEMQDTDEAHSARVIRKGGKYHVMFQGEKMHESAIMKMVLDKLNK